MTTAIALTSYAADCWLSPGRTGGGAELGGTVGMMSYVQRSAIRAGAVVLEAIEGL